MEITPINKWISNSESPLVIAGPCSAESEEQMLTIAKDLKNIQNVKVFRAGIWKPRTRPLAFEGVGETALSWLKTVKKEFDLGLRGGKNED